MEENMQKKNLLEGRPKRSNIKNQESLILLSNNYYLYIFKLML